MKYAQVSFAGNMEVLYDFKTDLELLPGDPVVCDTARGFSVGKVVALAETSAKATNWIVQKVDVAGHKERLRQEKELDELLGL